MLPGWLYYWPKQIWGFVLFSLGRKNIHSHVHVYICLHACPDRGDEREGSDVNTKTVPQTVRGEVSFYFHPPMDSTWLYYACSVASVPRHRRLMDQDWSVPCILREVPWPRVWGLHWCIPLAWSVSNVLTFCAYLSVQQSCAGPSLQTTLWVTLLVRVAWYFERDPGTFYGMVCEVAPVAKRRTWKWEVTFLSLQREGTRFWVISPTPRFRYFIYILKSDRSKLPEFLEEKSAVCFLPSPCLCGGVSVPPLPL